MILETPVFSIILGIIFGFILIALYGYVSLKFTEDRAKLGLYVAMGLSAVELIVAVAVVLLYRHFAPLGMPFFGGAMAVGFILGFVLLVVLLLPRIKKDTKK